MGFRTVLISSRCKLEHRLNYLIVRGETEKHVLINEINTVIIQSTAVSLTASLLCELVKNNIKVIFCDEKYNPHSELVPYYGAHNTSKRYKNQVCWDAEIKKKIWKVIIKRKIGNQAALLLENGFKNEHDLLKSYEEQVQDGDVTNREGHAAKVYFNCILPDNVSRKSGGFINACLNYGYAVILSAFNREIAASGYLTQLGIWHDNEFNPFNLSSDLMEPFRPLVDSVALTLNEPDDSFKREMADILNYGAFIEGKRTTLDVAIKVYVKSVLYAIENKSETEISFPTDIKKIDEQ